MNYQYSLNPTNCFKVPDDSQFNLSDAQQRLEILCHPKKTLMLCPAILAIILEELTIALEELQTRYYEVAATRQALELEHQKYQDLFYFAPDAYIVTDCQGLIQEANQAAILLLHLSEEAWNNKFLIELVSSTEQTLFRQHLSELKKINRWEDWEICLQPSQEKPFPVVMTISTIQDLQGKTIGLRWLIRDISDRKQREDQMRYELLHDPLTGLANRTLLLDRLTHLLQRYKRRFYNHTEKQQKDSFAVMFLDLDNFKRVNDSFGHLTGDHLLQETAKRLLSCVRQCDTVARLGGDEFVIILEDIESLKEVKDCATRIKSVLALPVISSIKIEQQLAIIETSVQVSIGIVLGNRHYQQPEEIIRDADLAMYHAKKQGRAGYQIFKRKILK